MVIRYLRESLSLEIRRNSGPPEIRVHETLLTLGVFGHDRGMAKLRRAIIPNVPHHVTQRDNRRQTVFFGDDDYRLYVELLREHCRTQEVAIWAWCLMPNHNG